MGLGLCSFAHVSELWTLGLKNNSSPLLGIRGLRGESLYIALVWYDISSSPSRVPTIPDVCDPQHWCTSIGFHRGMQAMFSYIILSNLAVQNVEGDLWIHKRQVRLSTLLCMHIKVFNQAGLLGCRSRFHWRRLSKSGGIR